MILKIKPTARGLKFLDHFIKPYDSSHIELVTEFKNFIDNGLLIISALSIIAVSFGFICELCILEATPTALTSPWSSVIKYGLIILFSSMISLKLILGDFDFSKIPRVTSCDKRGIRKNVTAKQVISYLILYRSKDICLDQSMLQVFLHEMF